MPILNASVGVLRGSDPQAEADIVHKRLAVSAVGPKVLVMEA